MVRQVGRRLEIGLSMAVLLIAIADRPGLAQMPLDRQAEAIAQDLIGTLSTTAQAKAHPPAVDVTLTTCRITVTDPRASTRSTSAIYLYQEQALSSKLQQPYRQRFLQLVPSPYSQTVQSISYKPQEMQRWINFCQHPLAQRIVAPGDLGQRICVVYLKQTGEEYVGATPVDGCPGHLHGATRIKNQIRLNSQGMDTWDRGYDDRGKQVWGAKDSAYQYRRISPIDR